MADIYQFTGCTFGSGSIPDYFSLKTGGTPNQARLFLETDIVPYPNIQKTFHQMSSSGANIYRPYYPMMIFTEVRAATPQFNFGRLGKICLMKFP